MKINVITIMYLAAVSLFIFACVGSSTDEERKSTESTSEAVIELDAKEQLIKTILNNPDLIRFSKMSLVLEEFDTVYMFITGSDVTTQFEIQQDGHSIKLIKNLNSIDSSKTPCYIFEKLDIARDGKSAEVFVTFDLTGAFAEGRLVNDDGQWVPDKDFLVGTR